MTNLIDTERLSARQRKLLIRYLDANDDLGHNECARQLGVTPTALYTAITNLTKKLIRDCRIDPASLLQDY